MSSTTIRYSTLPENSQSIDFGPAHPPHSEPHADPAVPGAYRYDPAAHDPSVPETDPRSPRYEPPHLRHRPGDTWEIGGKPHDEADPGPYGTPGWYQDRRTGRHRRGELPDPLPPEDAVPTWPNPVPRIPIQPDRPAPRPRRHRHEAEPEQRTEAEEFTEEPYHFTKIQEEAWERWLVHSACLAAAHTRPHRTVRERMSNAARGLARWIGGRITGTATPEATPEPDTPEPVAVGAHRAGRPPRPAPRTGNGYINAWELQFDAHRPATQPVEGGLT